MLRTFDRIKEGCQGCQQCSNASIGCGDCLTRKIALHPRCYEDAQVPLKSSVGVCARGAGEVAAESSTSGELNNERCRLQGSGCRHLMKP